MLFLLMLELGGMKCLLELCKFHGAGWVRLSSQARKGKGVIIILA